MRPICLLVHIVGLETTTVARERELKSPVKVKHQNPINILVERLFSFYCHSPKWTVNERSAVIRMMTFLNQLYHSCKANYSICIL